MGGFGVGVPNAAATPLPVPADLLAQLKAQLPPKGPSTTWAGSIPGTSAYIAVVSRGGQIEAFVCDGDKTWAWLAGNSTASSISAANKTGSVALTGKLAGSSLIATLTLSGTSYAIKPKKVAWPAGLYEAYGVKGSESVRAGWIVLPNGSQRGAKQVGVTGTAVSAVNPASVGVDIDGDGTANPAVSSTPVPFQKKVDKKNPPPGPSCASVEGSFNTAVTNYNNATNDADSKLWGNALSTSYRLGMQMGCGWAPPPQT